MTRAMPELLDDAGHLTFIIAEATVRDETTAGIMLAAMGPEAAVGIHLHVELMTGNRIYFPAALYSIGVPSDGLVRVLASAWDLPGAAMVPTVPSWIWPPRANFKGGAIENAVGYKATDLGSRDADLSLQICGADDTELVWFPLLFRGDHVHMQVAVDERAMLLAMLTGTIRARHFAD